MMRFKCPTCGRSGEVAGFADLPSFPFCSDRCKLVDLGRWIDGAYAIPDQTNPAMASPDDLDDEED